MGAIVEGHIQEGRQADAIIYNQAKTSFEVHGSKSMHGYLWVTLCCGHWAMGMRHMADMLWQS